MKFWFTTNDGTMAIDNENLNVDLSGVPSDVRLVIWDGNQHVGEVEKKGQMQLRTRFADSSAYQPQINRWILAAQTPPPYATQVPISLAQAKQIKHDMVDDLYLVKIAALSGGDPADITNAAIQAMTAAVNAAFDSFNSKITSFNSQMAGMAGSVNGIAANTDANMAHIGSTVDAATSVTVTHINDQMISTGNYNTNHLNDSGGLGYVGQINAAIGSKTDTGFNPMPSQTMGTVSDAPIPPAVGSIAPVGTLTSSPTLGPMDHIGAGGASDPTAPITAARNSKHAQINALTTVPAVAAYDVNAGW